MRLRKNLFLLTNNHGQILTTFAIIFYILVFSLFSLWKYFNYQYNAMDLAIIHQVFYNSSLGNFYTSSIHPPTYLGDHFNPILILLLPFYAISPTPETLLVLQSIFLGLSAWPIFLITKRVLNKNWAVILSLMWLVNPIVQNINLFEFHFLPIAIFLILWTFYFYQQNKFWPFLVMAILALLVREDVSLVIFMFGVVAWLQKRKIKWIIAPLILSSAYFLLAIKITNYLAPASQYKFFIYYSWLGENSTQALKNLFLSPWLVLLKLFTLGNFLFTLGLLMSVIFLPIISSFYLLLGLPIFLQLILGASGGSATLLETHYSSLLLPPIFIAAIYSLKTILTADDKLSWLVKKNKDLAWLIFIVGLIYLSLAMGPSLGVINQMAKQGLISKTSQGLTRLTDQIPQTAAVATSYSFLANLSARPQLYSLNYAFIKKQQFLSLDYALPENTQYLLIDFNDLISYQLQYGQNDFYKNQYQKAQAVWPEILKEFGLIDVYGSVGLFQKQLTNGINLIENTTDQTIIKTPSNIILNEEVEFLGYNKKDDLLELFWQVKGPLQNKYRLEFTFNQQQKIYPFAYDLLTSDLSGTKKIQTNYWLEESEKDGISLQLVTIEKGGIMIDSIRSTKNIIDQKTEIGQAINISE